MIGECSNRPDKVLKGCALVHNVRIVGLGQRLSLSTILARAAVPMNEPLIKDIELRVGFPLEEELRDQGFPIVISVQFVYKVGTLAEYMH